MILISHGSGGIGANELSLRDYFVEHGFKVGLVDYFSKWGITKINWCYIEKLKDTYEVTFNDMLKLDTEFDEKIVHIGFSLGGFLGIKNSEKFLKNYCFYPGIVGYTAEMVDKDYQNTTVILGDKDNWCDNYESFENACAIPPKKIIAKNATHGFMSPGKNIKIPIAKYIFKDSIMNLDEFLDLRPNFVYLTSCYSYVPAEVRLKHNAGLCKKFKELMLQEIVSL